MSAVEAASMRGLGCATRRIGDAVTSCFLLGASSDAASSTKTEMSLKPLALHCGNIRHGRGGETRRSPSRWVLQGDAECAWRGCQADLGQRSVGHLVGGFESERRLTGCKPVGGRLAATETVHTTEAAEISTTHQRHSEEGERERVPAKRPACD